MGNTEGINVILVRFVALANVINHQPSHEKSMLVMQNDNVHTEREKLMDENIKLISSILKCEDEPLLNKVAGAIAVFDSLDLSQKYHLAFSGGKDSHALLIVFLVWQKIRQVNTDNFVVLFADTLLETQSLYSLITAIEETVKTVKIQRVYPRHSYWWYQFAYGVPVPTNFNRWCTGRLKVDAMQLGETKAITGRHFGESEVRDARLSSCSSGECGTDKIKSSYDPILNFRNCDVWDLIFYSDGTVLYEGVFNALKSTYNQSEDKSGSLRMGCFMCPVVGRSTIVKNGVPGGVIFREFLEEMRKCARINNPRTKNLGAIYIGDRRMMWKKLNKELLLSLGYITQSEIELISECLESDYSYPKTYTREWIDSEHERLAKQTIYTGLPLFEYSGK
jgi:3'-phosphoadenosine 5'-phosphosulfate sulfotransferase (PAPS reductase)/FAD synthetase